MYWQSEKNLQNSNISPTCSHNIVNFRLLISEICWRVWGTPANFNGFRILASLLQRRCSMEVNQTFHDVWPSPVLVHYIYTFSGALTHNRISPCAKFTLRPTLAFSNIGSATAWHLSNGHQRKFATSCIGITELLQRVPSILG